MSRINTKLTIGPIQPIPHDSYLYVRSFRNMSRQNVYSGEDSQCGVQRRWLDINDVRFYWIKQNAEQQLVST